MNCSGALSIVIELTRCQQSAMQAEAVRKAKDWTVGMAAYDQVLAKLKNVGSLESHSEEASPETAREKQQEEAARSHWRSAPGKTRREKAKKHQERGHLWL